MAEATIRSGSPEVVDYTPTGGDVAMGQVVVLATVVANNTGLGLTCGVAQRAISNNAKGALAIGAGEYNCVAGSNVANWQPVFWDDTNNKVVNTSTNNSLFGYVSDRQSAAGDVTNAVVTCLHKPFRAT